MAENLLIHTGNKEEKYRELLPQLQALVSSETNRIANLANIAAALKQTFHFFWVGFYMVEGNELVLAPFQGPIACTRIRFGRGVCGTAWKEAQTVIHRTALMKRTHAIWKKSARTSDSFLCTVPPE